MHLGLAVLLIGVAASSSFQHSRDVVLKPGQSASVDGYKITYVRPTATATAQKLSFGAVLDVSNGGHHVTTLHTTRGFYPSQDPTLGQIGRFFNGNADSNVGLRAGITKDIWTVINPNLQPLQPLINQGDRLFAAALPKAMQNAAKLPPFAARNSINQLGRFATRRSRGSRRGSSAIRGRSSSC